MKTTHTSPSFYRLSSLRIVKKFQTYKLEHTRNREKDREREGEREKNDQLISSINRLIHNVIEEKTIRKGKNEDTLTSC